jgi:hypothetical protein
MFPVPVPNFKPSYDSGSGSGSTSQKSYGKSDPVLRIRIRTDPYHFGKQDLDPHLHHSDNPDPEPRQKSRIRIKV